MSTNIKIIRKKMQLTQSQLSKILGVSVYCVRSWEQGSRIISRLSFEKLRAQYRSSKKIILSHDDVYNTSSRKGKINGKPMAKSVARNAN